MLVSIVAIKRNFLKKIIYFLIGFKISTVNSNSEAQNFFFFFSEFLLSGKIILPNEDYSVL